ncbi:MAG: AMIN domain-containing protein, partial [Cyanobacteria bacterium]|nr:AMIN domain-containing protein [Cyanobacteriota bacterium]
MKNINKKSCNEKTLRDGTKVSIQALGRTLSLGLLGFSVLSNLSAFADNEFPLQSIDFVTQENGTNIFLHTGSIVPYHTVLTSDNKIVIDIDHVLSEQTVKTNFAEARNISHVVLQPLSAKSVRLIIRGEELGTPNISFKDLSTNANGALSNLPTGELDIAQRVAKPIHHLDQPISQLEPPEPAVTSSAPSSNIEGLAPENHPIPTESETNAFDFSKKVDGNNSSTQDTSRASGFKASPITLDKALKTSNPINSPTESPLGLAFLEAIDLESLAKYGIILGLFIGLGVFIRQKFKGMQKGQRSMAEIAGDFSRNPYGKTNTPQKKLSFNPYESSNKTSSYASTPRANSGTDGPIGLRGLQGILPEEPPITPVQRVSLPPMPKKQAINQYAQQAKSPIQNSQPRPKMNDDMLKQEIQRSQEIRRQAEAMNLLPTRPKN